MLGLSSWVFFIQNLKETSVSKQWRTYSDAMFSRRLISFYTDKKDARLILVKFDPDFIIVVFCCNCVIFCQVVTQLMKRGVE